MFSDKELQILRLADEQIEVDFTSGKFKGVTVRRVDFVIEPEMKSVTEMLEELDFLDDIDPASVVELETIEGEGVFSEEEITSETRFRLNLEGESHSIDDEENKSYGS